MMNHAKCTRWYTLIGRILLGALFLISGYNKIGAFDGVVTFMGSVGLPESSFLLWIVILVELLGGLALIVGFKSRLVAWGLIVFTFLTIIFFHRDFNDVNLLKNLAVIGGLLYVVAYGAGHMSIDGKKHKLDSPSPTPETQM